MSEVLPKEATWIKDEAVEISPKENVVKTKKGDTITYDYLLIAVGLKPNFDKVKYLLNREVIPFIIKVARRYLDFLTR